MNHYGHFSRSDIRTIFKRLRLIAVSDCKTRSLRFLRPDGREPGIKHLRRLEVIAGKRYKWAERLLFTYRLMPQLFIPNGQKVHQHLSPSDLLYAAKYLGWTLHVDGEVVTFLNDQGCTVGVDIDSLHLFASAGYHWAERILFAYRMDPTLLDSRNHGSRQYALLTHGIKSLL